jgi:hypothetical protein
LAGFRVHVTTSTLLGCGYAGAGFAFYGFEPETAIVGGALCGFAGMLPDLDSDYGVPLRETMAFTAAIVPMLLVNRFQSLALSYDAMVLVAVSMYLFVRFGVTNMVRRYTVHRGMFHSIPAALIFAGIAFLVCGAHDFPVRCFKAGGVFGGFMSHLILDEIYAVEWKGGAWRFKKSFGTAIKFLGDDAWANFSTYAKLIIVLMLIMGEPTVMEKLEARYPEIAHTHKQLQQQLKASGPIQERVGEVLDAVQTDVRQFVGVGESVATDPPPQAPWPANGPQDWPPPTEPTQPAYPTRPQEQPTIRREYGTAQRPGY